ncbi:hypothetical protein F4780DRAFT_761497 [Xylariomycetidae sp. FL0641]|nr:hypothetical protein F4780DRAFT_761497 [Xylariomycetidae sp. FL0641]
MKTASAHRTIAMSALAAAFGAAHAQESLSQTIVGCAEVGCPADQDGVNDNCTIAGSSYPNVGLTRIGAGDAALAGLSWLEGFNSTTPDDGGDDRTLHRSYYLATPPDVSLDDGTGACAVFLHGIAPGLSFVNAPKYSQADNETVLAETEGTCADAMGDSCVQALLDRAKKVAEGLGEKASSAEACQQLQSELEDNFDDECLPLGASSWRNLTATPLTGGGKNGDGPITIAGQANASTTCWPVDDKSDGLALVHDYAEDASLYAENLEDAAWGITPILTVFFPGNGSLVESVDASMSCIKAMGPSLASLDADGDTDTGAAGLLSPSRTSILAAMGAVMGVFWCL